MAESEHKGRLNENMTYVHGVALWTVQLLMNGAVWWTSIS